MAKKKQAKKKRQFTDEQRKSYLQLIVDRPEGASKASVLDKHQLSPNMVSDWGKKYGWPKPSSMQKVPAGIASVPASNSNEVVRLREENKVLKQLLKAAWG